MPVINAFLAMSSLSFVPKARTSGARSSSPVRRRTAQERQGPVEAVKIRCAIIIRRKRPVSLLPKFFVRSQDRADRAEQFLDVADHHTAAVLICQTLITRMVEGDERDTALHIEGHFFRC